MNRRDLLKTAVVAALPIAAQPRRDLIRDENARPGTTDWQLTKYRIDPKSRYRSPAIEGYCSRTSVQAGEELAILVSTNPASSFVIDIYRLGYYGGKGGRHITQLGPFRGQPQPDPEVGVERLRQCQWEPATKLTIPKDWPSGVYLGKLTEKSEGLQSYVIFIVRDDRPCDFLFQCSDTTWCAYNRWPNTYSLYDFDNTDAWHTGPGVSAGFDRPYGKYRQIFDVPQATGSGEFLFWEFPFAFWLEKEGYDVSYISNLDTHADAAGLLRAKAFLSVGHDEYWSLAMFDHVKAAIDGRRQRRLLQRQRRRWRGGAAGQRAGHQPGRQVRRRHRAPQATARLEAARPRPRPLMGAKSTYPYNGRGDWTCTNEKHWIFDGTGMKNGDAIPDLVGWEHHGEPANIAGLEVVARGMVYSGKKPKDVEYTATVYPGPKNNIVFNAATIWWADGLAHPPGYVTPSAHGGTPKGPDTRVQRMTANVLKRMLG